jgi:Dolichyl-phosphate-mannose-protein mannosyltransferase
MPEHERVTPRVRSWLLTTGAGLCLAEIWIAGLYYSGYQVLAGRHGWFPNEMAFLLYYLLFGLPAIALLTAALAGSAGQRLLDGFDRAGELSSREVSAAVVCASALTLFLVTVVRYGLLKDAAISDDEHAYAFMGQLFASGRIYVPSLSPALRPFLDNQFIVNTGKMYGIYFPGHPAALAIGERLHAMAWVPTVSATLTVPLAFGVARRIFGLRAALLTLPLLLVSPYFVFPSATLLAHSTAAVLLMAFVYSALRLHERPDALGWWIAAGVAVSWAALTRPFSTPFFAAPWLVWLGMDLWRRRTGRAMAGAAVFCLIGVTALGLLLAYQNALSGSPFISGYQTFSRMHHWGLIGKALEAIPPLPSIHELMFTLARINFWLFGWPASLLLIFFFRRTPGGIRLVTGVAAVFLVYAAISAATIHPVGPVHYSELAVPLVILSASGLERLVELGRGAIAGAGAARAVATVPVAATLCALATFYPVYGGSLRASADLTRAPYDLLAERGIERALVFVHSLPALHVSPYSWAYYRRNNSPDLTDPILFVNYLGPEKNKELMRHFPDRPAFSMGMKDGKFVLLPAP